MYIYLPIYDYKCIYVCIYIYNNQRLKKVVFVKYIYVSLYVVCVQVLLEKSLSLSIV